MKQRYVVGIARNDDNVVLIRKNRPDWQKGLFNFVGGKIEPDEFASSTMIREFYEETGIYYDYWNHIGFLQGMDFTVEVFYANDVIFDEVRTMTDEEIVLVSINEFETRSFQAKCIENLLWIWHFVNDGKQKTFDVYYGENYEIS